MKIADFENRIGDFENRIDELGLSAYYNNILSEISNFINYVDGNLSEDEADELIEEFWTQIKLSV